MNDERNTSRIANVSQAQLTGVRLKAVGPRPRRILVLSSACGTPRLRGRFYSRLYPLNVKAVSPVRLRRLRQIALRLVSTVGSLPRIGSKVVSVTTSNIVSTGRGPHVRRCLRMLSRVAGGTRALGLVCEGRFKGRRIWGILRTGRDKGIMRSFAVKGAQVGVYSSFYQAQADKRIGRVLDHITQEAINSLATATAPSCKYTWGGSKSYNHYIFLRDRHARYNLLLHSSNHDGPHATSDNDANGKVYSTHLRKNTTENQAKTKTPLQHTRRQQTTAMRPKTNKTTKYPI